MRRGMLRSFVSGGGEPLQAMEGAHQRNLRSSFLWAPLLLAGCSAGGDSASGPQAGDETIECALAGASAFKRDCVVERAPQDGVLYLVVRHPDGAFRRFKVLKDGRGVGVADGADTATTRLSGGLLEVTVDKDRYRFPATEKPHVPTS